MSLWNCAEHGLHGPMLGNLCPTCGQEMTWTTTTIASSERAERTHIVNPTPPPASGPTGTPEAELEQRIPAEWAEAANSARGLCESEANKWETASPSTAAHWRAVAVHLGALYLTQDHLAVSAARLSGEASIGFDRDTHGDYWCRACGGFCGHEKSCPKCSGKASAQGQHDRFVCPECGPVGVEEDGTCRTCGADTTVQKVPRGEASAPAQDETPTFTFPDHVRPDGAGAWSAPASPAASPVRAPHLSMAETRALLAKQTAEQEAERQAVRERDMKAVRAPQEDALRVLRALVEHAEDDVDDRRLAPAVMAAKELLARLDPQEGRQG